MGSTCKNEGWAAQLCKKFGRVFIHNSILNKTEIKTKTPLSKEEFTLLENTNFSNVNLRLFEDAQEIGIYTGRKFSFGFEGHLLEVPIPLGSNCIPSTQDWEAALEKEIEVAKQLKLIDDAGDIADYKKKRELIEDTKMCLFWALTLPDRPLLEQEYLFQIAPVIYIDDLFENFGNDDQGFLANKKGNKPPYKLTSRLSFLLRRALENYEDLDPDPVQAILKNKEGSFSSLMQEDGELDKYLEESDNFVELYSVLHFFLGYVQFFRKETIKTGKANGCSAKDILTFVAKVMDAFFLEYSGEWRHAMFSNGTLNRGMGEALSNLRKTTGMGVLFIEGILLQRGIQIGDSIRASKLFDLLMDQVGVHLQKVNNLMSFEKEMKGTSDEWQSNEACVLHKTGTYSEFEAKEKMAEDANLALAQIQRLCQTLRDVWKGKKEEVEIDRFSEALDQLITGTIQWYVLVRRYDKNLQWTLDCYIH